MKKGLLWLLLILLCIMPGLSFGGMTPNYGWDYGTEDQDPWWTMWENLLLHIDTDLWTLKGVVDGKAPVAHTQAESTITFTDIVTGNASITAHGYMPKLNNNNSQCYSGQGNWVACSGGAGSPSFDQITSGTNLGATMTVGTGATLNTSGSGIINANQYKGTAGPSGLEFGYLAGVTGALQTQIDGKAPSAHNHDSAYIHIIPAPTEGNFPTITLGGELQNSSYGPSSFSASGHTHTSGGITDFTDAAKDAAGAALTNTSTLNLSYNPGARQISGTVNADSSVQKVVVRKNTGADVGSRRRLNLIEGSNVTLTVADDGVNNEVNVTIAAPGVSGYNIIQEEGADLTQRTKLNFIGGGITAADDAGGVRTNITLDADLSAIAALAGTGIPKRTGPDTWAMAVGGTDYSTLNQVWGCTTGDCSGLTATAGDSLNAGSADSSAPFKQGVAASLPGTCSVGHTYLATDTKAWYICTASNTWTLFGVLNLSGKGLYILRVNAGATGYDLTNSLTGLTFGGFTPSTVLGADGSGDAASLTTGTGVITALGVNTGSPGAFVVNGGALGTPSSGTLTNVTGLPISGIVGLGTGVGTAMGNGVNGTGGFITYGNAAGTAAVLTGWTPGAGTVAATDTILQGMQKLSGNVDGKLPSTGAGLVEGIGAVFDGGGSALTSGATVYREVPFGATINRWTVMCKENNGGTVSDLTIDVWKIAYTPDTLPTVANTLCSTGTKPHVDLGAHKTGQATWDCATTSISAGDVLAFSVTAVPTGNASTWCSVTLKVTR